MIQNEMTVRMERKKKYYSYQSFTSNVEDYLSAYFSLSRILCK